MVTEMRPKRKLSERVEREKEELLTAPPRFDVNRIKCLLEAYAETEGQPAIMSRAKYFEKMCTERDIRIDGGPFVGSLTPYKYGGSAYPEIGCRWMGKVDTLQIQRGGAISIGVEERKWLDRAVVYWRDRNVYNRTQRIILECLGVDIGSLQKCGVVTEVTPGGAVQAVGDFSRVLNMGINGVIAEILAQRRKLDIGNLEDLSKRYFYDAALTCLNAMVSFAQRHASLAKEMAEKELNTKRKRELLRIAETCGRVPAHVPRNFYEAMQSLWFCILGQWIELPVTLQGSPLRFTQYMYPFYKKDKDKGRITDEEVIEMIQFLFLKINSLAGVLPPHGVKYSSSRLGVHLAIGGLNSDGTDATNELDWLVLEAQERIQLPEPLIDLMYHDKLSEAFLLKCVDLIRTGIGQPAFHDLDKAIQRHMYHDKMSIEEARTLAIAGCVQSCLPGHMYNHWEGYFNTSKAIELALNNGKDPLTGIQLGPQTGEAESFQSYNEVHSAVVQQLRYFIPILRQAGRVAWNMARDLPSPFGSAAFTHDCVGSGKDVAEGGTKYGLGNGVSFIAVVDLANSLAAIKKLVFEEKKITIKQLKKALLADFKGYEEIHRMCLTAPKYGNDDDYTDLIAKELYDICWNEHQKFPDFLGRPVKPEAYSVIAHVATGRFTGALPSGRKARLALTDASVSAQPGTDIKGPTALVKSAAAIIDTVKYGANHFNLKFHPAALKGKENARKFLSLMKTYFELGGYHAQFNCVTSETLKDAQLHPENYRNLIVRVAGFSAYFITLDRETQDEIVKRTDLKWN